MTGRATNRRRRRFRRLSGLGAVVGAVAVARRRAINANRERYGDVLVRPTGPGSPSRD